MTLKSIYTECCNFVAKGNIHMYYKQWFNIKLLNFQGTGRVFGERDPNQVSSAIARPQPQSRFGDRLGPARVGNGNGRHQHGQLVSLYLILTINMVSYLYSLKWHGQSVIWH
jgi:hypothetical protein